MATEIQEIEIIRGPTELVLVEVGSPGQPGAGVSAPDWTQIRSEVTTLNNTHKLANLGDVTIASPADAQTLVYEAASSKWKNKTAGEAVRYVKNGTTVVVEHADRLAAGAGLTVAQNGAIPTEAVWAVIYGTTAGTAAEGNHVHSETVVQRGKFAATGIMSSGNRTLATLTVPLVPGIDYTIEAVAFISAQNNVNNGTFNFGIRIGGSGTYPEETETYRTVGGVPRLCEVETSRPINATSVNVVVRAIFDTGDPVDLRAGRVIVRAYPRS